MSLPAFPPPKLLLSQPARSAEAAARIATGTLTVAQQAANRRRKRKGELRASASRPLVASFGDLSRLGLWLCALVDFSLVCETFTLYTPLHI